MQADPDIAPLSTGALVRAVRARLDEAGLDGAGLDAALLVGAALGADRTELVLRDRMPVAAEAQREVEALLGRRLSGEPVSRIVGEREFWSMRFAVSPHTLDPRPDTETLVDACLEVADREGWREATLRLADLGTGSGCVLAALLKELPHAYGIGVDRDARALGVAHANLQTLDLALHASLVCADWMAGIAGQFDLIVSNPPYIRSADIDGLQREVALYDPRMALDGGADGLDAYRAIAGQAAARLTDGGWLILEIGEDQGPAVTELLRGAGYLPDASVAPLVADLAGRTRCIRMRLPRR